MELVILGSSSKGNCYIFKNSDEILVIESGVNFRDVKIAIDFNISKIVGLLVSHSHLDHSKSIKSFIEYGINVYTSKECFEERGIDIKKTNRAKCIIPKKVYSVGGFKVIPFELIHNVKNYGFLIKHNDTGKFVFITDTMYVKQRFKGLNNIIVEANYSNEIIDSRVEDENIDFSLRNRVLYDHMEIETTLKFLKENNLNSVNNIVLIHLSDGNSDEEIFKRKTENQTGKTVTIAKQGTIINFNKTPF